MSRLKLPSMRSRRLAPARKAPTHERHAWRPGRLELLEDRLAPASNLVLAGGLEFLATTTFQQSGADYNLGPGAQVAIGYQPIGTETFQPLVRVDLGADSGFFSLDTTQPADPFFNVYDVTLSIVAVKNDNGASVPIPIWKSNVPEGEFVKFDIPQLLSTNGLSLDPSKSTPIQAPVAHCDFSLGTLYFNNPDSTTTANSQVEMQGVVDLSNLPIIGKGLTAEVTGTDYVVVDASGVNLTGFKVTKALPSNTEIKGFDVAGSVSIEYSTSGSTKSFTLAGSVTLSSAAQDSGQSALQNITGQLSETVADTPNGLELTGLGIAVGGSFKIFGVSVSTPPAQPLSFAYNASQDQFEVSGDLNVAFNSNTVQVNLGSTSAPGIIFQQGVLTQFNGYVTADFSLFGAKVISNGLTFMYNRDTGMGQSQFEMFGSLQLQIPSGSSPTIIAAQLGDQNNPGLIIQNGTLTQVNIGIASNATLSVFGLNLIVNSANVEWQQADNTFLISGSFQADFKIFKTAVQLGNTPQTGLVIQDGGFSLKDAKFALSNANLGAFTIKLLTVEWDETSVAQVPYTLAVQGDVVLPGGLEAAGGFRIENGKLDEIDLTIDSQTGVPIPGTGVFVTELGGKIENLDDPAHLVVQAHMALIYGEKFSFGNYQVNVFRAEGDITADASELVLGGTVLVGAYTDDGITWKGAIGQGDAKLTLDWAEQIYDLHIDVDGLLGIFDISGDLTFEPGKEIDFLATANIVVPPEIPFIGGDTLGGLGFFFQHVFPHDNVGSSTTVAAWIDIKVIWNIEVGVEVYVDPAGNVTVSPIGNDQIDNFGKEAQPPVNQSYTYTADLSNLVPADSTYLTFSTDWSKPAPGTTIVGQPSFTVLHTVGGTTTTIPEADFAANGIQLINDPTLTTGTSQALQIVGSTSNSYATLVGSYEVQMSFTAQGGAPFPHFVQQTSATLADYPDQLKIDVTHYIPLPSFGPLGAAAPFVPAVPATPNAVFPVHLAGNMDDGLISGAMVNVYLVRVNDPMQLPIKVGSVAPTEATGGGVNWQATVPVPINGLYPLEYRLYATVNDGVNAPAKSMISASFTPTFAVEGSVANQNHDALSGWTVYLDYNRDGQLEPNEPYTTTSINDGFFAFPPTFDPSSGFDSVPIGQTIDVRLIVPSDDYVPQVNPISVKFNGNTTEQANFVAQERSAITGTVFNDFGNDGEPADGTPVPGATVFLDGNGNGQLDQGEQSAVTDASGEYTLNDLQPGTYTVRYQPTVAPPVQAISAPSGTSGTQDASPFTFGNGFTADAAMEITSLGVFADGAVGHLSQPLTAVLYDAKTQLPVTSLTFTPQDSGTEMGGYFYKALPTPIHLYAGFQGIIAAYGFGPDQRAGDPYYVQGNIPWVASTDNGLVTYTVQSYAPAPGTYPGIIDTAVGNTPYAAGSFLFQVPTPVLTTPAAGSYTVTIDDSGFDLVEYNDFGLRVPASVSGTITTQARSGATPTPTSGVVVDLYSGRVVVASATTDANGQYTIGGLDPGTYSVSQEVPAGSRQVTPVSTDVVLSQPNIGGDAFYLPQKYLQAGYVLADVVAAHPDGNANPAIAVLAVNHSANYQVPTPDLFIYSNGDTANPTILNTNHPSIPVAVVTDPNQNVQVGVLYQDGGMDTYALANGRWQFQGFVVGASAGNAGGLGVGKFNGGIVAAHDGQGNAFFVASTTPGAGGYYPALWVFDARSPGAVPLGGGIGDPLGFSSKLVLVDGTGSPSSIAVAFAQFIPALVTEPQGDWAWEDQTWIRAAGLPLTSGPADLVAGDINGDGLPDLGVVSPGSFAFEVRIPGEDRFSYPSTTIPTIGSGAASESLLIDMNGDGRPDLVTLSDSSGSPSPLVVALNTGVGPDWFQPVSQQQAYSLAGDPSKQGSFLVKAADLDGDGSPDLVILDGREGLVEIVRKHRTTPVTLSPGQVLPLDFGNVKQAPSAPGAPPPPPPTVGPRDYVVNYGSGDSTVTYRAGNVVVTDNVLGFVRVKPLTEMNSLTIIAPDGRPGSLTIDESGGNFSLPGGIHFIGSASDPNQVTLIGGPGNDAIGISAAGATLNGQPLVTWTNLDQLRVVGGDGADQFRVSGDPQARGLITLVGGPSSNVYQLAAVGSSLAVVDSTDHASLDFQDASAGVSIDLRLDQGQPQAIGAGGNTLSLYGSIADLIGTPYDDMIRGNSLDNIIRGLGGNDVIVAGTGNSILIGGGGDDILVAGPGRDLQIGGAGRDILIAADPKRGKGGSRGGSILVAGATAYDADDAALEAIMAEWASRRPRFARAYNLLNGRGSRHRLNGSVFLNAKTIRYHRSDTVVGDNRHDWLRLGRGSNKPYLPLRN